VEKVTVIRSATKYKDEDLTQRSSGVDQSVKIYKLTQLYDRCFEYANLLSSQGLVKEAVAFLKLTPPGYKGSSSGTDLSAERDRLIAATGGGEPKPVPAQNTPVPSVPTTMRASYSYPSVPAVPLVSTQPAPVPQPTAYPSYQPAVPVVGPYTPAQPQQTSYVPQNYTNRPYNPSVSLTQPPHLRQQPQPAPVIPPPPCATNGTGPLPPPKKDNRGWNDAPSVLGTARTPAALNPNKPAAITSPFPNATQSVYSPQGSPI
jgi:protein transport protein SEC31